MGFLLSWLAHWQMTVWSGVLAMSIPAVGIVFTGTKALIRPGRNIASPEVGWMTASTVRFASQRELSEASPAWGEESEGGGWVRKARGREGGREGGCNIPLYPTYRLAREFNAEAEGPYKRQLLNLFGQSVGRWM